MATVYRLTNRCLWQSIPVNDKPLKDRPLNVPVMIFLRAIFGAACQLFLLPFREGGQWAHRAAP